LWFATVSSEISYQLVVFESDKLLLQCILADRQFCQVLQLLGGLFSDSPNFSPIYEGQIVVASLSTNHRCSIPSIVAFFGVVTNDIL